MVPVILMIPDRRFAGAIGSAGGNAILAFVAKSLVGAVDWNLPMHQAIALPNLVARGPNFQGEVDKFPMQVIAGLRSEGDRASPRPGRRFGRARSDRSDGQVDGGYDPRREGRVLTLPRP